MIFSSWFRSRAYNIICILRRGYRRGSASVGSKVKNYLPVSKGIKGRYWKKSEKSRWNIWRERVKGCTFAPAFRKEMQWYLKGLHKQLEGSTRAGGIRFLREGGAVWVKKNNRQYGLGSVLRTGLRHENTLWYGQRRILRRQAAAARQRRKDRQFTMKSLILAQDER